MISARPPAPAKRTIQHGHRQASMWFKRHIQTIVYIAGTDHMNTARMNTVRLNTKNRHGGAGIDREIIFIIAIH